MKEINYQTVSHPPHSNSSSTHLFLPPSCSISYPNIHLSNLHPNHSYIHIPSISISHLIVIFISHLIVISTFHLIVIWICMFQLIDIWISTFHLIVALTC